MEQSNLISRNIFRKHKYVTIAVASLYFASIGPFVLLSEEHSLQSRLLGFITMLVISLVVLSWCYYDSLERGQPITTTLRVLIVIFGGFALCYYLIKTRRLKRGFLAIVIAVLIFSAMLILMVLSASVVQVIFDIPDPN